MRERAANMIAVLGVIAFVAAVVFAWHVMHF